MKIITNNQERDVIRGYELTEDERKDFDYIDWDSEDGQWGLFVRYKGELYHLDDLERSTIKGWNEMVTETFFSGVLFKYPSENFETVIVGRYYA